MLSLGEPDFPPPEPAVEAAVAALRAGRTRYTYARGEPSALEAITEDVRRDGVWMHYRVARSLAPTVQAVLNAAVEALTSVRTTEEDRKQFQRAFGQLYVMSTPTGGACCAPRA